MNIVRPLIALLLAGGFACADGLTWIMDDYEKSLSTAKEAGKLLQVDWSAEWCGWCKKLEKDTFSDSKVQSFLAENFVCARLDKDKFGELAKKMGVGGIPALLFIDSQGRIVGRIIGFLPPEKYLPEVQKVLESYKSLQDLEASAAKNPKDEASLTAVAKYFEGVSNPAESVKSWRAIVELGPAKPVEALWSLAQAEAGIRNAKGVHDAGAKLVALDEKNEQGHNDNIGVLEGRAQADADPKAAIAAFEKVVSGFPGTDGAQEAMFMIGAVMGQSLGDYDGAVAQWKKLQEAAPDSEWGKKVPGALKWAENMKNKKK